MKATLWTLSLALFLASPLARAQEEDMDINLDIDMNRVEMTRIHIDDFHLSLGGRFVLDGIKYGRNNDRSSGLETKDARFYLAGYVHDFSWRVESDLKGTDTPRHLYESWLAWDLDPALRLTGGQFRVALGSEFATREEDLPFPGYGFPAYLDGRYDVGLRADGDLHPQGLWYEATVTSGQGFDLEGHRLNSALYALRLVGHPFTWFDTPDSSPLRGFFGGAGLAYLDDFDDPIVVTTPLESQVFRTRDLDGDGGNWIHYEMGYHHGPFRLGWERVVGSADNVPVGGGDKKDMDQLTAWEVYGSWNITGEEQVWDRGRWQRPHPRGEDGPGWAQNFPGRLETGVRYSNADIDRSLFDYGLTTYNPSTQEVRTFSLDLSWWPMERARIMLAWVNTIADDDLGTFGDTNRDSSFVLRLDLGF